LILFTHTAGEKNKELEQRAVEKAAKPRPITKAEKDRAAALTTADAEVVKLFAKQVSLKFQSVVAVHFIQLLLSLKL
jgi:hypothetical protein